MELGNAGELELEVELDTEGCAIVGGVVDTDTGTALLLLDVDVDVGADVEEVDEREVELDELDWPASRPHSIRAHEHVQGKNTHWTSSSGCWCSSCLRCQLEI